MVSIFQELKKLDSYYGNDGTLEMRYLYSDKAIDMSLQMSASDLLIGYIISKYKNDDFIFEFDENIPLICYFNVFMSKLNTIVKEDIIKESWIIEFTNRLIYQGKTKNQVKLGLVLSNKYLENEKLKEVVDVFSKSGEYIFYLMRSIRKLDKYNSYLFNLAKLSNGSIKVFAITNVEILDNNINTYLIEEGYKDDKYEKFLINYIFSTISISKYLSLIGDNSEKINKLAYLIVNYLRGADFSLLNIKYELVQEYLIQAALLGNTFYALYSIFLIKEGIWNDANIECNKSKLEYDIRGLLKEEKWIEIFKNGIKNVEGMGEDIVAITKFYDYKLSFCELKPYLQNQKRDFDIYWYIYQEGNLDDKKQVTQFFLDNFDIDELTNDIKDITRENINGEHVDSILFSIIIKISRSIYPDGIKIALCGLGGNINDVREESIRTLIKYKDKLSTHQLEKIKEAYDVEPNVKLKSKLRSIVFKDDSCKSQFVNVIDIKVEEHQKDIYLMSTEVAGARYRDKIQLEKELNSRALFYLQWEKDNEYDKRAIRIVAESGFVIGYIKRADNFILCNLLKGGKYLYCKVKEFDLYKDYIHIKIYLSYKDVQDDVSDVTRMILSSKTGKLIN